MSTINTNGLDVNYPVPGVNNNSQGFRNNFTNIKQNLDIAYNEISDLQTSVVLKNSLGNATINNNMGNVLISNAATLGFRATTYNLGSALTGQIVVDLSLADVHYGTLAGNVLLNFGNWAPTGTLSKVTLQLSTSNVAGNYNIQFPGEVIIADQNSGAAILNNYETVGGFGTVTFPHNCTQLILECSSLDCGNSIYITPINRPYQSVQIQTRTPASTGDYGDVNGTVCVDPAVDQLTVTNTTNTISLSSVVIPGTAGIFTCAATSVPLAVGQPVTISGIFGGSGSIVGYLNPTTYYIIATDGSTTFTLSTSLGGSAVTTTAGTPTGVTYSVTTNLFTTSGSTAQLYTGLPVVVTGTSFEANVTSGNTYYVRNVVSNTTFTLSTASSVASNITVATGSGNMYVNPVTYLYIATDSFNATLTPKNIANTTTPNIITFTSPANLNNTTNSPIMFTGTFDGNVGILPDTVYYIKSVSGSNITISQTRYNGVAGPEYQGINTVANANLDMSDGNIFVGTDIFRRIPLQPF